MTWLSIALLVLMTASLVGLIWHLRASMAELRRRIAEAASEPTRPNRD